MQEAAIHGYIHKKHAAIVPELTNVLRQMKKEGLFEKYREESLQ